MSPETKAPLVAAADEFAASAHAGQIRNYNGRPYIEHPRSVARLVRGAGLGEEAVAAALLHDVVEDTEVGAEEIRTRFGDAVADLVAALTEDPSIELYEDRKDAHRARVAGAGPAAATIYAADKLSNARDLRTLYRIEGEAVAERFKAPLDVRIVLWERDVEQFEALDPQPPFVSELAAELAGLRAARAEAS